MPARAEQQHGSELRIDAAAHDQLVSIARDHGLNGDTLEMSGARLFPHAGFDRRPGAPHSCFVGQVQLHAADIGLVRDGFRMQLQDDRITDLAGELHRLVWRVCDHGLDGGNAVERKQLLGFRFRKQRAARLAALPQSTPRPARAPWSPPPAQEPAFRRARADCTCSATCTGTPSLRYRDMETWECRRDSECLRLRLAATPPIQLARIGLPSSLANGFSFSAICVGSVMPCGVMMTSSPSLSGSLAAISTALA